MNLAKRLSWFPGLLVLCLASCGSDPVGKTVPVKGKITVDGKALTKGSVAFWPDEAKGNKSTFTPGAQVGEDGSFELYTNMKRGAPPGHYKVTVMAQTESDSTAPTKSKLLVPEGVTKKETTTLLVEVTEDPAKTYDLAVK